MCQTFEEALSYGDLLQETVGCKKAAIVVVFFIYILYTLLTGAIYFLEFKQKDAKLIQACKNFKNDIEQKNFFFLVFALLIQILTPNPFSVIMLYLYIFATFPLLVIGHFKPDKWKLRIIAICIQILLCIIIIFELLIDPWCRHYYFRYVVGVPDDAYLSKNAALVNANIASTNSTGGTR